MAIPVGMLPCNGEDNNAGEHKEDCSAAGDVVSAGEGREREQ